MNPAAIEEYLLATYDGLIPKDSWGEKSFFYNPGRASPHGTYFFTIKSKDGDNDKASQLDRAEVYRLNFCVSKPTFEKLFGQKFARPAKGEIIKADFDFSKTDTLSPHPIYGWMSWVAVLSPSAATFERAKPLIDESYALAVKRMSKKLAR